MIKQLFRNIMPILACIFIASCSSVRTSTLSPSLEAPIQESPTPTPIATVFTPTNQAPTAEPAATFTDVLPTPVQPTDENHADTNQDNSNRMETDQMIITIGDNKLSATLIDNSSTAALKEALKEGPLTINMSDYGGMEKVGPLGMELPRNDVQITTKAGDIILYQGNAFVIYYAPNSWNFTKLGQIDDITAQELKQILGNGNVTITLSLE